MTLINNADPYAPGPLPDSPEDVARLIEETIGVGIGGGGGGGGGGFGGGGGNFGAGRFAKDMASLAGMWYSRFVQEVNAIKEDRDAELALLVVGFFSSTNIHGDIGLIVLYSTAIMIILNDSPKITPFVSISPAKSSTDSPLLFAND